MYKPIYTLTEKNINLFNPITATRYPFLLFKDKNWLKDSR